jgi:serine/threonine protein kinase
VSNGIDPVLVGSGVPRKIAGYRLVRYIGQGRKAVVYVAQDERRRRQVALKVLTPELAVDAAFRGRMLRESQAAAAVEHPHIVPVYEAGNAGQVPYVAMLYVPGGDAQSLLNRLGPLPLADASDIIAQVASALDAAHARGLVHRDVKPANFLLGASAGAASAVPQSRGDYSCGNVYLCDFGMGRDFSPGEIIATDQPARTLDYVAPEQIEGRALDGRADLYSLACAAFELLCGTPPFGQEQGLTVMYAQLYAPPPAATAWRPDLPAAVNLVLATALAKNPADRYATCGQFAEELRDALGLRLGQPNDAARSPALGRAGPPADSALVSVTAWPRSAQQQSSAEPGQPGSDPPDEPASRDAQQPRRRITRFLLPAGAIFGVVAAVIAVSTVLAIRPAPGRPAASSPTTSSPSPSPSPSPSAALGPREAAAVSTLLNASAAARRAMESAVSQVQACTDVSSAVSQIQGAVNDRSTEYSQAPALLTSALPDSAAVKSDLIAALGYSLTADREYLAWARQQLAAGCTLAAQSSAYGAASSADRQADAAKQAFARVWNPVAAQYDVQPKNAAASM